ncbi:dead end protein 1-like isoform X2 [Stigmatopora nigra]
MERRALHQEMFELCTANAQVPIKNPLDTLEKWLQKTNIRLTQVNGQRKYGGPPSVWHGPAPGSNCEVFIGHIPRDMYEDKLIPLFSSVGPLWEFRLMMNFSGHNRGFAYAKYGSAEIAQAAIHQLHGHMLEPGVRIVVYPSTEKRQLWITELPMIVQEDQLFKPLGSSMASTSQSTGTPKYKHIKDFLACTSHGGQAHNNPCDRLGSVGLKSPEPRVRIRNPAL